MYESEEIDNEQPLKILANRAVFYPKNLDATRFPHPKSFNFVSYGFEARHQGVHLVLLSKTFNLSAKTNANKYVSCSKNVPTHQFALLFPNATSADEFYSAVENHLDREIECSGNWMTPEVKILINELF